MTDDVTGEESHEETTRRRWPAVTAVTAGVVLLAGAFYGVGLAGDEDAASSGGGPAAGPLPLDARRGAGDPAGETLTLERSTPGPLVLSEDPPAAPDAAAVYRFEGPDVDAERVAELAADLGLAGAPEASGGSWSVVGTPDGTRQGALLVAEESPGHWFYSLDGTAADGTGAVEEPADPGMAPGEPDPSGGPSEDVVDPGTSVSRNEMPPADGEPAPTAETALQAAEPLLTGLGLDVGAADASTAVGPHRLVVAEPVVDGLAVAGMDVVLTVGPDGEVLSAAGTLGAPTEGEERAVTDAAAALERVNEGADTAAREIGQPCLQREPGALPEADGAEPALPDLPCDGAPAAAEPTPATVELGLSLESSEGEPLLVPAWIFRAEDADGERYTVAEPAVEFTLSSDPDAPVDSGPSDGGSRDDGSDGAGSDARPGSAGEGEDGAEGSGEVAPAEPAEPPTAGMWVAEHSPEALTLSVNFWAGVCDTYEVTASESADEVVLSVETVGPDSDEVCIMLAEQQTDEVTLREPLGDRRLVDEHGRTLATH